jgi:hypothetical protein
MLAYFPLIKAQKSSVMTLDYMVTCFTNTATINKF